MKTILVVDDDPDVTKLLKSRLEELQRFKVVTASGGKLALALVQSHKPDLVLCDIDMPDMDGGQLAEAIEQKDAVKDVPIIFLSSLITQSEQRKGPTSGQRLVI